MVFVVLDQAHVSPLILNDITEHLFETPLCETEGGIHSRVVLSGQ